MPRLGTVRNYSSRACPETLTKLIPLGRMGRGAGGCDAGGRRRLHAL